MGQIVEVKAPKKSMEEKEQEVFTTIQLALKAMNAKCGESTRPNPMALEKNYGKTRANVDGKGGNHRKIHH
jgi:hypothetical protein